VHRLAYFVSNLYGKFSKSHSLNHWSVDATSLNGYESHPLPGAADLALPCTELIVPRCCALTGILRFIIYFPRVYINKEAGGTMRMY
jgi:hypothetical protein